MRKQLPQLRGVSAKAVPNPGLPCPQFVTYAQYVVYAAHTMQEERFPQLLAEADFLTEDLKLQVVGGGTGAVESAFADG